MFVIQGVNDVGQRMFPLRQGSKGRSEGATFVSHVYVGSKRSLGTLSSRVGVRNLSKNKGLQCSQCVVAPSCWSEDLRFLDHLKRSFCNAMGQWDFFTRGCSDVLAQSLLLGVHWNVGGHAKRYLSQNEPSIP